MIAEWLVAALLAQAATPVFAPPPGVTLTLEIDHRQTELGKPEKHYRSARRIVFTRDGAGWRATLAHGGASVDAPGDAFARAMAATLAQPIVYRLDAAGTVTGIDAIDTVWDRFVAAMRTTVGERAAAPLEALPTQARLGMLQSLLSDVIEARAAGEGPFPAEPIDLPAAPIAAGATPVMLPGTRMAVRAGARVIVMLRAAGSLGTPAGATGSIDRTTRIDPATGLLDERREHMVARLADGTVALARDMTSTLRYPNTRRETRFDP